MKREFFKGIVSGVAVVAVCTAVVLANPGGEDDPLISKSYLNTVFMEQVQQYINTNTPPAPSFEVVSLKKGQKMVCGAGCELILRQGSAVINATAKGGIANVTAGDDLADGIPMPANNHLIVPVGDGRGITAKSDVLVMVKGTFEIK